MRSKTLLIGNILSTIYSIGLFLVFGNAIIEAGATDFIETMTMYFEIIYNSIGFDTAATILYVIVILLCAHIVLIILGCIFSWIAYIVKKSGLAKLAATFYLIATICFPIYLFFSLPITIVGFIGGGKQKTINKCQIITE